MTLVAMLIAMTSCNKWDCNGDLDGMWQLTEWRDKDNAVKISESFRSCGGAAEAGAFLEEIADGVIER